MTIADPPVPASYGQLEALSSRLKTGNVQVADICLYCDTLAHMGLWAAVNDFFQTVRVSHPQWTAYQIAARARVNSLPPGVISWTSRRRRYEANLAALLPRWPQYGALLNACESRAQRYQLHKSNDGNYQLRDTADPNPLDGWSGGLKDQKALAALWKYERTKPEFVSPISFDGVGFGWLLMRVLETTHNTYLSYSPAVYVVESDPLALWMLLHMHDLRAWIENPRLHIFLGAGAGEQYREFLVAGRHTLPDYGFTNLLTPRPTVDLVAIAAAELNRRVAQTKDLREQIERAYSGRTPEWWQHRFEAAAAGGPPLKIMGITSRFTTVLRYSMEELAQAICAAGHEFHLSIEPDDSTLDRNDHQLIHDIQPDLLIQISRMRYENSELPTCIPFLCWDQDYLAGTRTPEAKASLDHLTYVAGHAATHGYHEQGWPARNCIFAHLAAATHRYSDEPVSPDLMARYACDFSYVSNASTSPHAYASQLGQSWQAYMPSKIWKALVERALDGPAVHRDVAAWKAVIEAVAAQQGFKAPEYLTELALDLDRLMDRRFRHEALDWVADYCRETRTVMKLYGSGWENNPHFANFAGGPIEPGLHLRALYQATRINLQLILSGFLHARSLDGLAAGGFFLTRHSAADYDPDPRTPEFYIMARRALDLGIWNFEQLVAADDPLIADRRVQFYVDQVRALKLWDYDYFHVAGELAAAATVFPNVRAISFRSSDELHTLAHKYLSHAGERAAISQDMREIVKKRFSYDARLRTFLHRMTRGFARNK